MTDRERLDQLEILLAELLQKQDRNSEEVANIKADIADLSAKIVRMENKQDSLSSGVSQLTKLMIRQSENITFLLNENISLKEDLKELPLMKEQLKDLPFIKEQLKEIQLKELPLMKEQLKDLPLIKEQLNDLQLKEIPLIKEELLSIKETLVNILIILNK